jgi:hypothetical protein
MAILQEKSAGSLEMTSLKQPLRDCVLFVRWTLHIPGEFVGHLAGCSNAQVFSV